MNNLTTQISKRAYHNLLGRLKEICLELADLSLTQHCIEAHVN